MNYVEEQEKKEREIQLRSEKEEEEEEEEHSIITTDDKLGEIMIVFVSTSIFFSTYLPSYILIG
jgi:hypothetical protein